MTSAFENGKFRLDRQKECSSDRKDSRVLGKMNMNRICTVILIQLRELLETSGANSSFTSKYRLGESKKVGH